MTAPSPTDRVTPTGTMLEDGYQSLITVASDTDITFWEKTVTPPALEGGDKIDITTMHNSNVMTFAAQSLYETGDVTTKVAYEIQSYADIQDIINTNTTVTVTLPGGDQAAFFGYVKSFVPDENVKGTQPEATVTIVATNIDPASGDEEVPVFVTAAGTTL